MESQRDQVMQALRLAAIVESSDDAIISKDVNGTITSWNVAAERMFGWPAEEAIGRSIRIIIPTERQSEEDLVLSRIRRGERVEHFETVRCRRNGERFDVSITVSPIRTADGRIVGASKIARDISEWKRTTRALQEARAEQSELRRRFAAIIDASGALLRSPRLDDVLPAVLVVARQVLTGDGVAVWQGEANVWRVAASHGLSDTFTGAALDAPLEQRVPETDVLVLESVGESPFAYPREVYEAEGIRSLLVVPLEAFQGKKTAIAFYYRTLHQFSVVERESAAGLGRLTSAVIATAYLYDGQRRRRIEAGLLAEAGEILASSREYRDNLPRIAGRVASLVADWCAVHLLAEDGALQLAASAGSEETHLLERVLRARDGESDEAFSVDRVVRQGVAVQVDALGAEGCVGCQADRVEAARALGHLSITCAPLIVHGRTLGALTLASRPGGLPYPPSLEFAQDLAYRLALSIDNVLSYEEARTANRLKDEFLATLSHELRTPLNAIRGYAQMLAKGALAEEKRARAYEVLDKNAHALAQIVEDVLDVSRITAGKLRLSPARVALESLVRQSVETVQPGADAKGVRLRVVRETDMADVSADPDRLQQVFWNLLSNAVKFTPRDGEVEVRLACRDSVCEVSVIDTGAGIDRRLLPHIFERFRQGDTRYGREHGGLGLGLAIARQLVEMHGGTISATSDGPGSGATFRVVLPALAS